MTGLGYAMGFNFNYLLFMIPGLLFTLWAQIKVKGTFGKFEHVRTLKGLTGAQVARDILDRSGLRDVEIERTSGRLSDHFDPTANVVRLSQATYDNPSIGAVGIAAHECGHAMQYAENYGPIKLRNAIIPVANIGSRLSVPLIIAGMIINMLNLSYIGIALFGLAVLFQLITLPVEFNASRRAVLVLESSGSVTPEENDGVRKVLTAAALTYVAALFTSLLQLLYYVSLVSGRGGRRR